MPKLKKLIRSRPENLTLKARDEQCRLSINRNKMPSLIGRSSRRLIIIFGIIFLLGLSCVNFFRQNYVVPILMYHSINPNTKPENRVTVTPDTFERQMRFLKKHHYNVLPLESLVGLIKYKKKIPAKTVVITFDDGYKDNFVYAFPILKKYNLPATISIIVKEVGRVQNDRLRWDEIKAMQSSGIITFASHALGPDPLFKMKSEGALRDEIFDSKHILEEQLGQKINIFSYPEGMFDAKIRGLVIEAGYLGALATNPGKKCPNNDIFALKRLRISENAKNMFVFWIETSGFYTFMKERRHK